MSLSAQELYEQAMLAGANNHVADAVVLLQNAILLKPEFHEAYNNRGIFLAQLGNVFDAVLNYDKAIAISPLIAPYHNNRACALITLCEYAEAYKSAARAVELNPKQAESLMNMGHCARMRGDRELATKYYERCVEAKPDYCDGHLVLGAAYLDIGDYERGWKHYEWRWKSGQLPPRGLEFPYWNGEDLDGKSLFLFGEQGFGDVIQFCRFAEVIRKRWPTCKVTVEVKRSLLRLMRQSGIGTNVIAVGDDVPACDYGTPMLTAARLVGMKTEADIPYPEPYLFVPERQRYYWGKRIAEELKEYRDKLRVGICWSGGLRPLNADAMAIDRRRSTHLATFGALVNPEVVFISLQKGSPSREAVSPPAGMAILDISDDVDDWADTAALIESLDLVISVDTAIAHLAGALGKPTWVLSRFDNCWRWLGNRETSPWYGSVRVFGQPAPGEWHGLMQTVKRAFEQWVEQRRSSAIAAE